jgi:ribosomal protein S18 acetylase RimI-like enzyme
MSSDFGGIHYRDASSADVEAIAALHADSWKRNYRGAYLDSYLDGDVLVDRLAIWGDRLDRPIPNQRTIVAEAGTEIVGFAHTILHHHPKWGALLENLHVRHDRKGQGIGTQLMAESARFVLDSPPSTGIHLTVLAQNKPAQAFYQARGGLCVDERAGGPFPGGGTAPVLCYAWPDPVVLTDGSEFGVGT